MSTATDHPLDTGRRLYPARNNYTGHCKQCGRADDGCKVGFWTCHRCFEKNCRKQRKV